MCGRADDPSMIDNLCGLCLTCWPPPRKGGTACHDAACPCHVERATKTGVWAPYPNQAFAEGVSDTLNANLDATDMLRDRYPGYAYDGRDGSIEADDDDEDVWREEWAEFLEWQRDMGA